MLNEFLKLSPRKDELEKAHEWGFGVLRNFYPVKHTALDVVEQYQYAEKNKWIAKHDEANYKNRWLQFKGDFVGETKTVVDHVRELYGARMTHIYANWISDGHTYGKHKDTMDVIILQTWGKMGYGCESPYGEKAHGACTLKPGDAIYIRAGVWHTPFIMSQRMSLSFSW
jgi:ribosomal protein L16 Arg81 hydroxylase